MLGFFFLVISIYIELLNQLNVDPDPFFYTKVDISDFQSQYTKYNETFKQILKLRDPRDNMHMSSTTIMVS